MEKIVIDGFVYKGTVEAWKIDRPVNIRPIGFLDISVFGKIDFDKNKVMNIIWIGSKGETLRMFRDCKFVEVCNCSDGTATAKLTFLTR